MPPDLTPPESEVRLTEATFVELESRIALAVQTGIKGAITEETAAQFWLAGFDALQHHAAEHAGRFVLGGLWGLVRKLSLFLALGGVIYAVGGWSALAALAKTLFAAKA